MKYTVVACLAAILCLLGAIPFTPSSAQDIPALPHAFYGNVTINDMPAPNGTVVEARGEGVLTDIAFNPITVTEAGKYGAPGLDFKLTVQGNITDGTNLTFYVNNITAQCYDVQAGGQWLDSYPFESGNVTELNLKVRVAPEPDISVSPTEKDFGNINVGSSSSPQTFNVSNVGDADLVVWTINITGTHANQFTIHNDNVTNQTIIANGSATLQVVFSPTSTGAKSATLNIPSNDPYEPTVSVPLSGTGVTGGGGGGGGGALYYLTVNMLGDISDWEISEQGNLLEPLQVSSADNKVTIALSKDASCLTKGNNRLSSITISRKSGLPSLPEDYSIIGPAYEFRPAGAKFAPSLSLTLGYADNDVPQYVSEGDIYIAYYDATAENWVPLNSQVNTQNNRVSAPVRHFTTFAIIGIAVPPTPAEFSVTSLDLSSEQVEPGQEVLVTVNVTNTGGSEGSYTLDLTINGEVEQTKTVTLAPSASDTVTFIVIKEELGTYTVSVDGLTKEFIVGVPSWVSQYWWIVLLVIVTIGIVVSFLWARRRRVRA